MTPGDRIVIAGGPWPERIGAHGTVVTGEAIYPFHSVAKHDVVVLLDDDPLLTEPDPDKPFAYDKVNDSGGVKWSHVICVRDLVPE